eukprot:3885833-Prorocentrum_lima.AAC.1
MLPHCMQEGNILLPRRQQRVATGGHVGNVADIASEALRGGRPRGCCCRHSMREGQILCLSLIHISEPTRLDVI